jgi:hypothetical protein
VSIKNKLFTLAALIVGAFYLLESFLTYQSSGLAAPTFIKVAIAAVALLYAWRQLQKAKNAKSSGGNSDA